MNDQLEREIADCLHSAADSLAHVPEPSITEAMRRGKAIRRRRRMAAATGVFGWVVLAVPVVYIVLGQGDSARDPITPAGPPSKPAISVSPTTSPDQATQKPEPATTPCNQVEPPPANTSVDTTLIKEMGHLEIFYSDDSGQNHSFRIDYRDDPTCAEVPRLKQIIDHALKAAG